MKNLSKIILACLLVTVMGAAMRPSESSQIYISNFENVLGTAMEVKIRALSETKAAAAEDAALKEIDRLSTILSGYDPQSEFSNFLRSSGTAQQLSPELFEVLSLFDHWRLRTKGALDPSAEVLGQVWKNAASRQQLPTATALKEAIALVKNTHYRLDEASKTAVHLDSAPLMLNSFAKSYIIDKAAAAALRMDGVNAIVLNIGGDIVVRGALDEHIQIVDPRANAENDLPLTQIKAGNRAIATSGNYRRGYEINNKWYSHIVDPRTGQPADQIISATVVAPDACDAGALATAFNVTGPEESMKLLAEHPNAEALLITREGKRIASRGWKKLEVPSVKELVAKLPGHVTADKVWNTKYELAVNLEIAKIEGTRVHAPFVAVWVEDANKNTVRNLAVWYNKPKWLKDLRSWHRGNGTTYAPDAEKMSSIGSATRSAGKYTLKWDGKDDSGSLVKAGKYTIYIEAAREHGTHQLMSAEMNFNGAAQTINLSGNVEIASASLAYRKKSGN